MRAGVRVAEHLQGESMSSVRVSCAALLLIAASACGGRGSTSPAAPSPVAAPSGATIIGTVQSGGSAMLAATTGSAAAGLTVTVVGTSISTTVSGTGQFTLTGVPSGSMQLRFSGPGVDATITISVQGEETITITIAVNGSRAEVRDEGHENHGDAELHGTVVELSGTAAAFSFRIGGRPVRGDSATEFRGDGGRSDSFAELDNGDRVEVKGVTRDGFVYAQRIHIDDDEDDDDAEDDHDDEEEEDEDGEVEFSGTVSGLGSNSCPFLAFSVGGRSVTTNGFTEYKGVTCATLKNGDRVEVEGRPQSSGVLAREIKRQ